MPENVCCHCDPLKGTSLHAEPHCVSTNSALLVKQQINNSQYLALKATEAAFF